MPSSIEIMTNGLIGHDQYVLLCRRCDQQHWTLPGGGVTPGEPVERSLRRALQEQFEFSIHDYQLVAVLENLDDTTSNVRHEIRFLFEVNLAEPVNEGTLSGRELKWFWWGNIDGVDIRPRPLAEQLRDPFQQQRVWAPWDANDRAGTQ